MRYFEKYPSIIITILFVVGIVLASTIQLSIILSIILFFIVFLISFILLKKKIIVVRHIILIIIPLLLGIIRYEVEDKIFERWEFKENYIKEAFIYGNINDVNLIIDDKIKLIIETDSIIVKNKFKYYRSLNLLVNVKIDSSFNRVKAYSIFKINNKIKFKGKILNPPEKRVFGDINYQKLLKSENITGVCYTRVDSLFEIKEGTRFYFGKIFAELRQDLDITLSKVFNQESYSLLRGLILGDRGAIEDDVKQSYSKSGVAHVLAVSGLHIGLIIYLVFLLLGRFNIQIRYLLAIFFLVLFCNLTGNNPSVLRATIMGIIYILCKYFNRDYAGINSLFLALLIILIYNPFQIYSIGLQLSFLSVLTIIIVSENFNEYISRYKFNFRIKKIVELIVITISCQIVTLPILLYYFHQFSIIAIISNLFIIPLISIILILGLITLIIATININTGIILALGVQKLIGLNNYVVKYFAGIKYSYIEIYNFTIYELILFYIMIVFLFLYRNNKFKYVIILFILGLTILYNIFGFNYNNNLNVIIIDVGQGDSFLIKTPNKKVILIDAGNKTPNYDAGERAIIPTLNYYGINKIDYVFVSHVDADHYLGFYSLANKCKVDKLYKPKLDVNEIKDVKFENFLKSKSIKINYYKKEIINIDGVNLYILYIDECISKNRNDRSGIIKLVFGNTSFLFMGDATTKVEKILVEQYGNFLKADVLKAGHHGSNFSSDSVFINAVSPKYSVISCGVFNPYGLPSEKAIKRLDQHSKILRTDLLGTLIFESDGYNLSVGDLNNNLKD
jgi:competence protein ComEC